MGTGLRILLCVTVFSFCGQVKLPVAGGRLGLADPLFALGFLGMLWHLHRCEERVFLPLSGLLALLLSVAANVLSCPGFGGCVELVQSMEMFFGGTLVFSFMLSRLPGLCSLSVFLGLAANLALAAAQWGLHGFGSALPPADVMSLPWGFGHAYTGLFRSRMALAFFLALAAGWSLPRWLGRRPGPLRTAFVLAFLPVVLGFIPHGQILLVLLPVLLFTGALLGGRALAATLAALGLFALSLLSGGAEGRRRILAETATPLKSAAHPGELKTRHLDFIAALRLAALKPYSGIGAGRYQQCVGRCYRELPNPRHNDIDTDTQAGWGILCATHGFPAALAWGILFLAAAAAGIRSHLAACRLPGGPGRPGALGGSAALLVLVGGMFLSDAMTRGLGWLAALALVSALHPGDERECRECQLFPFRRIVLAGAMLALTLLPVASAPRRPDPLAGCALDGSVNRRDDAPAGRDALPDGDRRFLLTLNPSQAKEFTRPFERHPDSQAAEKVALRIPDGKGTPPAGQEPAMAYGGVRYEFQLPEDLEVKVWLRVRWDGSCGNTLNVLFDEEGRSVTAGNDGTYRQWHWVDAPKTWRLKAGPHQLRILNREDGIALDQVLVTADRQYFPQGVESRTD